MLSHTKLHRIECKLILLANWLTFDDALFQSAWLCQHVGLIKTKVTAS